MTENLLVELFVEELPPKALKRLGDSFAHGVAEGLRASGLLAAGSLVEPYASPRRLAVHITAVAARGEDRQVVEKLMPVKVGFDAASEPTPALKKKLARVLGVDADSPALAEALARLEVAGDQISLPVTLPGASLAQALQQALEKALGGLPIPKMMSYQLHDGWSTVHFVRPAHMLVALHGEAVVPVSVLGLAAGRETQGHRFEATAHPVVIRHADSYAEQMEREGAVIASFADRRAEVALQLKAAAERVGGGLHPVHDEALLDEVTALVERPSVLVGQFEERFLAVPQECLILTMKANQKYFPLLDASGKLSNKFLIVSNIRPADASAVVQGNERVVRPRLADAEFFFNQDRKKTLASRIPGLAKVVYHNKLGSQGARAERVRLIAHRIVEQLRLATVPYTVEAKDEFDVLDSKVQEAAQLAKADLLTDMVGEFPELQGIMGGYYARHEGLRDGVAVAIEDHYKPRFAGDALPRNHTGTVVALADKLETLVGLFGIGQLPTGDKDPFALRRHALGVIRILIEKNLPLSLHELIAQAEVPFRDLMPELDVKEALGSFFYDRLANLLREQGYTAQEVDAVLALAPAHLGEVPRRLEAVRAFAALPEAAALAAANKRVGNILKKIEGEVADTVADELLREPAEQALARALAQVREQAEPLFGQRDYAGALLALAALRAPVDAFFDSVMVNAEDAALRGNRQALLKQLYAAMNRVADLARLSA